MYEVNIHDQCSDGTRFVCHGRPAMKRPAEPTGIKDVAARLRMTRKALKLTQARLCSITGISKAAWNNAETGDARIGVDNAIQLCQVTGATLDWIFRGIRAGLPTELQEAISKLPVASERAAS